MKKTKLTRSLLAACSVVALSAVAYGCSSGVSDADHQAALDRAKAAEEQAAAEKKAAEDAAKAAEEAAKKAAEEAEKAKQDAVAEAERKAAADKAAAEKMARATVQTNAITAATMAAESALGMVILGATDAQIEDAEAKLQAVRDAIAAAVDVDDTSTHATTANGIETRLMSAKNFVHQDRAAKKMARAEMQSDAIKTAIEAAEAAVALVNVDGATDADTNAAAMTAAEKVQAARDAIAAAVDVDDTSMYTVSVNGIESSLGTATNAALAAYQTARIEAAIRSANAAVDNVDLAATDMEIEAAEAAVQSAKDAIAAAANVDETSTFSAQVDALDSSLTKAKGLVEEDRAEKKMMRAGMQRNAIGEAIDDAEDAVALVVDGASDEVITAARDAIQDARDAIADAVDVDDTSMYAGNVDDLEDALDGAEQMVLVNRAVQNKVDEQLTAERTKATAAMNAAKTAADNAETAAQNASDAIENIATLQVGDNGVDVSRGHATATKDSAAKAKKAYEAAKTASMAADEAETVAAAVAARIDAESARKMAEDYGKKAGQSETSTGEAVTTELFIDSTMKSVGGSTVDATAKMSSVTIDGQTTITGLIESMNPMHSAGGVGGVEFVAGDATATPAVADVEYVQAVAARNLTIGKTLDSSDDMARLMLVTHYAGSQTVKVYAENTAAAANGATTGILTTMTAGRVLVDDGGTPADTTDDRFANLKRAGTYHKASPGATDTSPDQLDHDDIVGAEATGESVYRYVDDLGTPATTDDVTVYVVLQKTDTNTPAGGDPVTTYTYQVVDIMAEASDATTQGTAEEVQVTATIPVETAYKHIHFGVWAGLGDARKDGSQDIADLGIGFVQSVGSGLTPVDGENEHLPASGDATYNGNWVAAIQEADVDGDGDITLQHGPAMLTADFGDDDITVMLTGLATLEGDISGNTFSGEGAEVLTNSYGLTPGEDNFDGSFSGGFYGPAAAEAGGIFDYTSGDMEDGAFRGAFGGDKK